MKVTIGMEVDGEVDSGVVVAMSKEWCIYKTKGGFECAENWENITLRYKTPTEATSSITEKEL